MMLQAFMDESDGGTRDSGYFCLAGYVARRDEWERFSDAWDTTLNFSPKLPYYRTSEYRHGDWETEHDLSKQQSLTRYRHFYNKLRDNETILFSVCVDVEQTSFNQIVRNQKSLKRVAETLREPYQHAFHEFVALTIIKLRERGISEPVDFMMDEASITTDRAVTIFKGIRAVADPFFKDMMGDPIPRNKLKIPPLQAADMLAALYKDHCYDQSNRQYRRLLRGIAWSGERNVSTHIARTELESFIVDPGVQSIINRPRKGMHVTSK